MLGNPNYEIEGQSAAMFRCGSTTIPKGSTTKRLETRASRNG
nr:MAG TPA: hypothetical protein [Caudoviricetes sp.]